MGDGELLLWRQQVALCLSDYASPECSKPDHRRLQWIVSRRTAQNLHSHRSVPELPTIPEGGWDESERSEPTQAGSAQDRVRARAARKKEQNESDAQPSRPTRKKIRNNRSLIASDLRLNERRRLKSAEAISKKLADLQINCKLLRQSIVKKTRIFTLKQKQGCVSRLFSV